MKHALSMLFASVSLAFVAGVAGASTVGQAAPDFTLKDTSGKSVKLSDFRGRHVVLEWVNPECPYVQKHYETGNMQGLQKDYTSKNTVWLTINSTREGHGEYKAPPVMADWMKSMKAASTATLLDPDDKVGRAYDARTTPHMYIVDPNGQLVYAGAIDDKRSTNRADVKTAKNFVRAAMTETLAGKPVTTASTTAYGCTIKY
jgi:alkyl hydroperoxide reductase subunit AhpC